MRNASSVVVTFFSRRFVLFVSSYCVDIGLPYLFVKVLLHYHIIVFGPVAGDAITLDVVAGREGVEDGNAETDVR